MAAGLREVVATVAYGVVIHARVFRRRASVPIRTVAGTPPHVNRHGRVDEATRARRHFRAVLVIHRGRAPAPVPRVPSVHHVLLRVRVVLRAVRVGPEGREPSRVRQSGRQLVVEMHLRMESGEYGGRRQRRGHL